MISSDPQLQALQSLLARHGWQVTDATVFPADPRDLALTRGDEQLRFKFDRERASLDVLDPNAWDYDGLVWDETLPEDLSAWPSIVTDVMRNLGHPVDDTAPGDHLGSTAMTTTAPDRLPDHEALAAIFRDREVGMLAVNLVPLRAEHLEHHAARSPKLPLVAPVDETHAALFTYRPGGAASRWQAVLRGPVGAHPALPQARPEWVVGGDDPSRLLERVNEAVASWEPDNIPMKTVHVRWRSNAVYEADIEVPVTVDLEDTDTLLLASGALADVDDYLIEESTSVDSAVEIHPSAVTAAAPAMETPTIAPIAGVDGIFR